MNINIYAITWNEEYLLPAWYWWYKNRFSNVFFTIYDNESTDKTVEIAKEFGIKVISFNTENKFNDIIHRDLKNKKQSGWVIFTDLDEFLDINDKKLEAEEVLGTNCFRFKAFDMYGWENGVRNSKYDKMPLINRSEVTPMYDFGAHNVRFSQGIPKYSSKEYNLYHFKYPSLEYYLNRTELYRKRFDEYNKSLGHGFEYFKTNEELAELYNKNKEKAIKII